MPLVNESAMLYFPNESCEKPVVTGCVRKNRSTCAELYNTDSRYYATESGNYLDMLPGEISFHRSGLNVNLNDESGITLSSSGNLSVSGGSVSISGGSVSINATSKIKVQKGKSGYISLENEFYSEASATCECGSDRESYPAFTDDDPTAGVAEALAKKKAELAKQNIDNIIFNKGNLLAGMSGVGATSVQTPTLNGSIMGSAGLSQENNSGESYIVPTEENCWMNLGYWSSVKDGVIDGIGRFSTGTKESLNYIGENWLGLDYDRPIEGSNKTMRQNMEEDIQRDIDESNKVREKTPYKGVFDTISKRTEISLDVASCALAVYDVVQVCKVGVSFLRSLKVVGNIKDAGNAENLAKVSLDTRKMSDIERTDYILDNTGLTREQVQDYLDINYYRNPEIGDAFRNEGIIKSGYNVLIPRSTKYLDEDGFINWELAPEKGYVLDDEGNAIKEILTSKPSGKNRMFDRYGNEYGNYLSPVDSKGNSYAFEKRALPYVEDVTTHHVYEETGNLSNIRNDIINSSLSDSRKQELLNKLGDNKTYIGKAKGAYDQIGGAEQVETPLSIKELCEIGTLTER